MSQLVECLICGYKAKTLAKHFKPSHGLTAGEYRLLHPGAPTRSVDHGFQPKLAEAPRVRGKGPRFEGLRLDENGHFILEGLVEGYHYVHCASCGHPAEDLEQHLTLAHPELIGHYEEAYPGEHLRSKRLELLIQRSTLKGRKLSDETKAKMSASAGWNRGLTKETDERVAHAAEAMKGRTVWNTGLTKADHPSLQSTSEKLSQISHTWSNGLKADLSMVDFTPYLDETGAVDLWVMSEELELSDRTLRNYMESIGLRSSTKNVKACAERRTIRLEKDELLKFTLGNGKVAIGDAMIGLGHDFKVIKRECDRHGLQTYSHRVRQVICLNAVAKALGVNAEYEQEWRSRLFVTEKGNPFRFDGHFPFYNLIVEFHGYQHYTFPSVYIKDEAVFAQKQARDQIKKACIEGHPTLRYFEVREDEPYSDPTYLRARLMEEGIFDPGK